MHRKTYTGIVLWIAAVGALVGETAGNKIPHVIGHLPNYRLTESALAHLPKCTDVVYFGDKQQSAPQKLTLAKKEKLAGVIIWELGQTPAGENSILKLFPHN